MEVQLDLAVAALIIFAAGTWAYVRSKRGGGRRRPPGPRPELPIIGNLLHLLGAEKQPHRFFDKLANKYGPLICLKMGSLPVVVASTPDVARQLLQTHGRNFASRPRILCADRMLYDSAHAGLAPYDAYWRLVRKLSNSHLLQHSRLTGFRSVREEETKRLLLSVLHDSDHQSLLIRPKLQSATNDTICRATLGKRFCEFSSINLVALMEEFVELGGAAPLGGLGDLFPVLGWLDVQLGMSKPMKAWRDRAEKAFGEVINSRRLAAGKQDTSCEAGNGPPDLLDVLLQYSVANGDGTDSDKIALTDQKIMAVLWLMFIAGTDTTSSTIEWALAEMILNPSVMRRVQEEVDHEVGKGRLVEEADLPQLPLVRASMKEVLRLHPPAPILVPRFCTEACEINGFSVPAKTTAFVNLWRIHRDPSIWENPLLFSPDRFLDGKKTELHIQQFEYLPFGAGLRICPGRQLAAVSSELMLANLLHCFDWEPPILANGTRGHVDMSETFRITIQKAYPLSAKATPRLPSNLIEAD